MILLIVAFVAVLAWRMTTHDAVQGVPNISMLDPGWFSDLDHPRGRVKSVTSEWNSDGTDFVIITTYNRAGKPLEIERQVRGGVSRKVLQYDHHGNLIGCLHGSSGKDTFTYYPPKNTVICRSYGENDRSKWPWYRRLLVRFFPDMAYDLGCESINKLDRSGKVIRTEVRSLDLKATYHYDSKGRRTEIRSGNPPGWPVFTFKYNVQGDKIEEKSYENGTPSVVRTYAYKYDKHGNWIELIRTWYEPGKAKDSKRIITHRKIKYYDK
jgi:hypothetical protein